MPDTHLSAVGGLCRRLCPVEGREGVLLFSSALFPLRAVFHKIQIYDPSGIYFSGRYKAGAKIHFVSPKLVRTV